MSRTILFSASIVMFLMAGSMACGDTTDNGVDNNDVEYGEVVDLSGTWVAEGYDCGSDFNAAELISLEISGSDLLATKLVGDACVPTGMETMRATLPEEVRVNMDLAAEMNLALTGPGSTTFQWDDVTITVISSDEFTVSTPRSAAVSGEDLHFHRSTTQNLETVDISGEWQAWGYTCNSTTRLLQAVSFEIDGNAVTATKTIGDDCIGVGEKTWEGVRNGAVLEGEIFSTIGSDPAPIEILARDFMLLTIDEEPPFNLYFWRIP